MYDNIICKYCTNYEQRILSVHDSIQTPFFKAAYYKEKLCLQRVSKSSDFAIAEILYLSNFKVVQKQSLCFSKEITKNLIILITAVLMLPFVDFQKCIAVTL